MGLMLSKEQPAHLYPFFFTNALRFKTCKLVKVTSRTSVIRNWTSRTSVIRHWMFRWTIRKRATTSPNRLLDVSASGGHTLWKNLGGSRLEGVMFPDTSPSRCHRFKPLHAAGGEPIEGTPGQ